MLFVHKNFLDRNFLDKDTFGHRKLLDTGAFLQKKDFTYPQKLGQG